jgi:MFS family permease
VLKSTFDLSFAQVGMMTLALMLTASVLQPVVGLITDRKPAPLALAAGMTFTLIGLLLLSTAWTFPLLLLAAALVGVGSSMFHPESSRVARMASGGQHGLAQSVFQVGGNAGSAIGPLMQFLFVVLILSFVILTPAVWKIPHATLVNPTVTGWLPSSWFLGLFERVRGSSRAYFVPLATRALIALSIAVAAAMAVSVATFRQQMRLALTPPAKPGSIGVGALIRHLARALAGRDPAARATADFVVVTLGRDRRQQGPVAMTAAIGAAIVLASLTQKVRDLESLMQPRTIVLWIPLVLTYWSVLGLRTAFLVPSELPAAVTFASHGPTDTHAYWSGVRGATIAVLAVPVTLVALVVTGLLVGWPIAAWHTAFVAGMVVTLVELAVLSLDRVPFTRPYAAGDGLLRTRWPLYLFGMFAFAYWPVRIELQSLGGGEPWLVAGAAGAASVCHLVGRARARRWSVTLDEPASDGAMLSVLDIGAVVRPVAPAAVSTPSAS